MVQASVNDKKFELRQESNQVLIDQQPLEWDLLKISNTHFHILYKNHTYNAELIASDREAKSFTLKINGSLYTVNLKDKFDLMLEKMGINNAGSNKPNNLKAPMPGLIVELKIQAGDTVKSGDPLLILEAMKMENVLKSPSDGTVKNVKVKKGDSVERGHILVEF
ncbi:MAG: acetyl-CoA carboxylase biotin carboxyl carrier protein subunit [Flammeovirgaceae bacterium]